MRPRVPRFIAATLLLATIPCGVACRPQTAKDPGEIRQEREEGLPLPGRFRSWETGDEVARALRRIVVADKAGCEELAALAASNGPPPFAIAAAARSRRQGCVPIEQAPATPLFRFPTAAAPALTAPLESLRVALFRANHPDLTVPVDGSAPCLSGFAGLEKVEGLSDSDIFALTRPGAVFGRLEAPAGYDLIILPDGVLMGRDAPERGLWRLATGRFAEPAATAFAQYLPQDATPRDLLLSAVFASDAGLAKLAAERARRALDASAEDAETRGDALFLLHEIERSGDEEASMRDLETLVTEQPRHPFAARIGFWRLAAWYNKTHKWAAYLALYRGPGAALNAGDSQDTRKRLALVEYALESERTLAEHPTFFDHNRKKETYRAYGALGDYEAALAWAGRALESAGPDKWELEVEKGRFLMKLKRWEEAEALFKSVLADKENFYTKSGKIYESFMDLYQAQARDDMYKWAEDQYKEKSWIFQKAKKSPEDKDDPNAPPPATLDSPFKPNGPPLQTPK